MRRILSAALLSLSLAACGPGEAEIETLNDPGVLAANAEDQTVDVTSADQALTAAFGITGTIASTRVTLVPVVDKLNKPTSLAFKPVEGSLWVVNRGDDSSVIVDNPGKTTAKIFRFKDDSAHFMNNPTQIAFSKGKAEFAVSLDSVNDYNGQAPGNYFTGPTLFTSDRRYYSGGAQSHLDMLHHSPKAMGISVGARPSTAQQDMREYWVFNGNSGSVDRYFFNKPHELGGDDHSDGIAIRYATGQIKRTTDVPGHLAFDLATRQLYIADTGNGRVVRLDTRTALDTARRISAYHNETALWEVPRTTVTAVATGLSQPSGILFVNSQIVVGEYGTGKIKVYSTTGELKGTLDTGLGARKLMGLADGPDGKLYVVDNVGGRALRVDLR